ncbi:hypothetical protein [Fortiea contorta]|nr:hypothetical protein [Fortiea contorta]
MGIGKLSSVKHHHQKIKDEDQKLFALDVLAGWAEILYFTLELT